MEPADPLVVDRGGAAGRARRTDRGWELDLTAGTGRLDVATASVLLADLLSAIADKGGEGTIRWRVPAATAEHHRIASTNAFAGNRRLLQMRRALPVPWTNDLSTRPFEPGRDEDDWLRVNNAAFAWHPEQSAWTREHLAEAMAQAWFERAGFLVHPTDGPLDGFCWTKIHHEVDPPLGEIYVIGVDPAAHGRGLGRGLVLAGLDHLRRAGITVAMLYTEADNIAARHLYDSLGFETHHEVTVFERTVQTPTPTAEPIP